MVNERIPETVGGGTTRRSLETWKIQGALEKLKVAPGVNMEQHQHVLESCKAQSIGRKGCVILPLKGAHPLIPSSSVVLCSETKEAISLSSWFPCCRLDCLPTFMMEEDTDLREGSTEQQPRDKQEFRLAFLFPESYPPESPSLERAPWPSSLIAELIQKLWADRSGKIAGFRKEIFQWLDYLHLGQRWGFVKVSNLSYL